MDNECAFDLSKNPYLKAKSSPFLRWAGGKRALLNKLIYLLPIKANHYYEPFIGGGALYFAISPNSNKATISDTNAELINCYAQVSTHPEDLINALSKCKFNEEYYYRTRKSTPEDDLQKAIRFIYLNRTCWNGLYRVNKKGEFNVPIGKFATEPLMCPESKIRKANEILGNTQLLTSDFEEVVKDADTFDFVYFDPPYTVKHDNNGFRQYNEKVFSWDDQERLSNISSDLKQRGVNIMISNANHKDIIDLYEDFHKYEVSRTSLIGGTKSARGTVKELIITSYKVQKIDQFDGIVEVQ